MHPENQHIAALIAVHNRLEMTRRCVECLRGAADESHRLEIVVVDDGSTDGTSAWLAAQPDIIVLRGDGGLWFGGATDLGLRHFRGRQEPPDCVLLINNDTFLRPGALARMMAEASASQVVATTYWTEDQGKAGATGFIWRRWKGLVEASSQPGWPREGSGVRPVDAICTTVVLVPFPLLKAATLPDPGRHPHNRYDAILSARLRSAGARFVCVTEPLADHAYGSPENRPSVRKMTLGRFWRESMHERRSTFHLTGGLALAWESAPNGMEAVCVCVVRVMRFMRQLLWVGVNSLKLRGVKMESS